MFLQTWVLFLHDRLDIHETRQSGGQEYCWFQVQLKPLFNSLLFLILIVFQRRTKLGFKLEFLCFDSLFHYSLILLRLSPSYFSTLFPILFSRSALFKLTQVPWTIFFLCSQRYLLLLLTMSPFFQSELSPSVCLQNGLPRLEVRFPDWSER